MNNMKRIYLAGRIKEDALDSAFYWREYASEVIRNIGAYPVNPMSNTTYFMDDKVHRYKDVNFHYIYHQDLSLLNTCDAVLVNLSHIEEGCGTLFELGFATAKGLPIAGYGATSKHPFIVNSVAIKPTIEEALQYLITKCLKD